jgi:hypothetical protein
VFELTPASGGGWTETVLHAFTDSPSDGAIPLAGLIADSQGKPPFADIEGTNVLGTGGSSRLSDCRILVQAKTRLAIGPLRAAS